MRFVERPPAFATWRKLATAPAPPAQRTRLLPPPNSAVPLAGNAIRPSSVLARVRAVQLMRRPHPALRAQRIRTRARSISAMERAPPANIQRGMQEQCAVQQPAHATWRRCAQGRARLAQRIASCRAARSAVPRLVSATSQRTARVPALLARRMRRNPPGPRARTTETSAQQISVTARVTTVSTPRATRDQFVDRPPAIAMSRRAVPARAQRVRPTHSSRVALPVARQPANVIRRRRVLARAPLVRRTPGVHPAPRVRAMAIRARSISATERARPASIRPATRARSVAPRRALAILLRCVQA